MDNSIKNISTKKGDFGCTIICDCMHNKDVILVEVLGKIDELQSAINIYRINTWPKVEKIIFDIQDDLKGIASELCGYDPGHISTTYFNKVIKTNSSKIPKKFLIIKTMPSAFLNECRVRTRSLERSLIELKKTHEVRLSIIKYINRLSDYFFVISYLANGELVN